MSHKTDLAVSTYHEGFNCAQSVLLAFAQESDIERDTALRVAAGFGGGIARTAGTCGAVTGAIMVLGLKYGAVKGSDTDAKDENYRIARELMRAFTERMGTVECRALTGYEISIPQERQKAVDAGVFKSVCPKAIAVAVDLVEELL